MAQNDLKRYLHMGCQLIYLHGQLSAARLGQRHFVFQL